VTEKQLAELISARLSKDEMARLPAITVFECFESELRDKSEFPGRATAFAVSHGWDVAQVGDALFGELVFYK
jgi:hypothetical protein